MPEKAAPVGEIRDGAYGLMMFDIPEDVRQARKSLGQIRLLAMPNGGVQWEAVEE